jgi:hypothetical protein
VGDAWQQLKALPALGGGCLATAQGFASTWWGMPGNS